MIELHSSSIPPVASSIWGGTFGWQVQMYYTHSEWPLTRIFPSVSLYVNCKRVSVKAAVSPRHSHLYARVSHFMIMYAEEAEAGPNAGAECVSGRQLRGRLCRLLTSEKAGAPPKSPRGCSSVCFCVYVWSVEEREVRITTWKVTHSTYRQEKDPSLDSSPPHECHNRCWLFFFCAISFLLSYFSTVRHQDL